MATLNETSGILTSPYYPRRYPSNVKCSWKIIASKGERILLFIEDIHIAECGSSCTCGYLEIQNGSSSDGISGRRRCRYYTDRGIVYHSVKDVLTVTFVSDSGTYRRYRGFKATYIKVKYNATNTGKLKVYVQAIRWSIFSKLYKTFFNNEWGCMSILWRIIEIEEDVNRWDRTPRRITSSEISIIVHMIRKPNSIIVLFYYSFKSHYFA